MSLRQAQRRKNAACAGSAAAPRSLPNIWRSAHVHHIRVYAAEGLDLGQGERRPVANINRPISGPTHEKELPVGRHPLQLYSLGTPNGVKVTMMLEELLALGYKGAEYDAWLIKIGDGDQFGSGFVAINPNSKIPALLDRSGPKPIRVFETGAMLVYLAEKFGAFLPTEPSPRAERCRGCSGRWEHALRRRRVRTLLRLCAIKIEYAINRFAMETKRLLDVLDKRLAVSEYVAGDEYTIADMAAWPWYGGLVKLAVRAAEFLSVQKYKNVVRWADAIYARPAVRAGADGEPPQRRTVKPVARAA